MPVCLALLNLLLLSTVLCVFVCLAVFSACFSSASLRSVDLLTPDVVMNFSGGNVYPSSVYTDNLCALEHA